MQSPGTHCMDNGHGACMVDEHVTCTNRSYRNCQCHTGQWQLTALVMKYFFTANRLTPVSQMAGAWRGALGATSASPFKGQKIKIIELYTYTVWVQTMQNYRALYLWVQSQTMQANTITSIPREPSDIKQLLKSELINNLLCHHMSSSWCSVTDSHHHLHLFLDITRLALIHRYFELFIIQCTVWLVDSLLQNSGSVISLWAPCVSNCNLSSLSSLVLGLVWVWGQDYRYYPRVNSST